MSGIYLVAALVLALVMPAKAQAQQLNHPKTIKLHNNATGEHIGTVTVTGNRAYIRDKTGEHIYTVVQNPDGSKTTFDPSGNIVAAPKLSD